MTGDYYSVYEEGGNFFLLLVFNFENHSLDSIKIDFNRMSFISEYFDIKMAEKNNDNILPNEDEKRGVQFLVIFKKRFAIEKIQQIFKRRRNKI